ncbi:hypothetical protein LSTR_LSTR001345 [Laodelphax striatellus]|uniref:DNA helicase MCM8 n=1 Tax=Laodelphax striatellus TaxID=195883 RepID=A0A482XFS2_LAOST|nr:hypothetical protein LSTR_LSTR001345 [Laodelphax striatellus]
MLVIIANAGNQCSSQESYTTPRETTKQIAIDSLFTPIPGCYKAWKLYFPMEEYNTASPTVNKIKSFEKYIDKNKDLYSISEIEKRKAFNLDLKVLKKDEKFMNDWPDFEDNLSNQPDLSLNCLSLAMHQFVLSHLEKELQEENVVTENISLPMIKVRPINYEPVVQMKHLTANTFGKLVSIQGTVIRVGQIKLLCAWLAFSCWRCAHVQCVAQIDGAYTPPTSCLQAGCQSRTFRPLYSSPYTQTVNWQTVKLQEILADDQRDRGRVPRTVECELHDELVDCCSPGDVVSITGIVKIRSSDESSYRRSKAPSVYFIYIEGKSVLNTKNYSSGPKQSSDVEFTTNDYYAIQEIQANPQLFRLAVNSLCPTIYGHEMVKAGLLLGLLGGAQGGCKRGDSHVLVVGDPGLGKSQMLQACSMVAPRGVYVCGNTSTSSGLTVTLTREGGGNFALEAGALVLADQGCCCIDEFDKMSSQHQALLEAMEQQVISITKAGIICTLPARTSILAAANPVGGHYNRAKTVSENLRLGSALLSRFDLVFILQDRPDEYLDTLLSEHVMSLYSHLKVSSTAGDSSSFVGSMSCTEPDVLNPNVPLSKRLKLCPGEDISPISPVLLRKYIAYAKKYIPSPELSPEAGSVLQNFYLAA